MGRLLKMLKRVRLVYRRSNRVTKAVVLAALVLSMAAVVTLQLSISAAQDRAEDLKNQAAQLEQDNQQLEDNIDGLGSADSVEQIAKDELGMVDPTTVIVKPQE